MERKEKMKVDDQVGGGKRRREEDERRRQRNENHNNTGVMWYRVPHSPYCFAYLVRYLGTSILGHSFSIHNTTRRAISTSFWADRRCLLHAYP